MAKIRNGFVSNSSSSSFIICKNLLEPGVLQEFKKRIDEIEELLTNGTGLNIEGDIYHDEIEYYISESKYYISGDGENWAFEPYADIIDSLNINEYVEYIER